MKTNPVYKREIMVSARSIRLALVLLVFNGILALVALLNMYSTLAQVRLTAEVQYTSFLDLYLFVAALEFVMLICIMPAITAGSISGERERKTLELMMATKMRPWEIVVGKLMASLSTMALLVAWGNYPVRYSDSSFMFCGSISSGGKSGGVLFCSGQQDNNGNSGILRDYSSCDGRNLRS